MEYRLLPAGPALRRWVRHFWILEGEGATSAEIIYPDGCMELAFHLGDVFADRRGPQPNSIFIGQIDKPLSVWPGARAFCIGAKFESGGAAAFLDHPLEELAGHIVSLDDVWRGGRTPALRQRLGEQRSDAERARVLSTALIDQRERNASRANASIASVHDTFIDDALRRLLDGGVNVDSVARETGLSVRQFERRVRERTGSTPKLLARIARFQRALARSQSGRPDWSAIAADCGYYDQAHLIRDFREFTGTPPTRTEPDLLYLPS